MLTMGGLVLFLNQGGHLWLSLANLWGLPKRGLSPLRKLLAILLGVDHKGHISHFLSLLLRINIARSFLMISVKPLKAACDAKLAGSPV